jgi:hypothetical protein
VIGWIKVPGDGASAVGVEVNGVRRHHGFGSATNAVLVWFWFWFCYERGFSLVLVLVIKMNIFFDISSVETYTC